MTRATTDDPVGIGRRMARVSIAPVSATAPRIAADIARNSLRADRIAARASSSDPATWMA